jgi:hypothetical protein
MTLWMFVMVGCGVVDYTDKSAVDTGVPADTDVGPGETDAATDSPVLPPDDSDAGGGGDTSAQGLDTAVDTAGAGGGGGGGGGQGAFPVDAYVYSAVFGYDPATNEAIPVVYQGQFLGPRFEFIAGSNAYFAGTAPGDYCVLIFESVSPMAASPLAAAYGGYFAMSLMPSMGFGTTCVGLQPAGWIQGLQQYITTPPALYAGGVHPGPFVNTTAAGVIARAGLESIAHPAWMTNPLNGFAYEQDLGYAIGYEMDDFGNVLFDATGRMIPLPISATPAGGPLQRAFYIASSLYYFPPTP